MTNKIHRYEIDQQELGAIHKICVFCWGLIGDCFVRVAIIEALHEHFPGADITVVVDPPSKIVFDHHPAVSDAFVFSRGKRPFYRYIWNTIKCCWRLRQRKYDLSINLYSGGSSPVITRVVNARIRLGFDHTNALRKANNLLVKHPSLCTRWTKAFGTILRPLGIDDSQVRQGTTYFVTESGKDYAKIFFQNDMHQYVVINPGARIAEKRWAIERFAELAEKIWEKYHLCPLVLTNPGMAYLAEEFEKIYKGKGHYRIAPLTSLDNVAAIMKRCRFVITGDTSIMHLAFGLKCPTLVLFTYTRPDVVEPVDCMHADCFIAGNSEVDECGNPMGIADIPVDLAYEKFTELYNSVLEMSKHN